MYLLSDETVNSLTVLEKISGLGNLEKSELKLTNVARASLEELRLDYEDFLRQRGLPTWDRDDPRRQDLIDRRCATSAVSQLTLSFSWLILSEAVRYALQSSAKFDATGRKGPFRMETN